jgi:hypothetical protein
MLAEAAARAARLGAEVALREGDIRRLGLADASVDAAVCIRFLNWVDTSALPAVLGELARVSRRYVIAGLRHHVPALRLLAAPHGLGRLARQLRARLRHARGQAPLIVHPQRQVLAAFRAQGLAVRAEAPVESSRDGSEYRIYLLETEPAPGGPAADR